MKSSTLLAILLGTTTVGFVGWRVCVVLTSDVPQYDIVEDVSGSHGPACESLKGLVAQIFDSPGATSGSALSVILPGDRSTANEPRRIGTYPIPTIRRVAEGASELTRERENILAAVARQCKAVPQPTISPIFLAVEQAVADLRARGCDMRSHCRLIVDSDLQETVEISIRTRLNGPNKHAPPLPPPIDNAGINVGFCGYAVAVGRTVSRSGKKVGGVQPRSAEQEERLKQIWRELFTTPETVIFEPYCSTPPSAAR